MFLFKGQTTYRTDMAIKKKKGKDNNINNAVDKEKLIILNN